MQSEYVALRMAQPNFPAEEIAITQTRVYPNPSPSQVNIEFGVEEKQAVTLDIYNSAGKRVTVLQNGTLNKGRYKKQFTGLSSGIYNYRLTRGISTKTGSIMIRR